MAMVPRGTGDQPRPPKKEENGKLRRGTMMVGPRRSPHIEIYTIVFGIELDYLAGPHFA